MFQIVTELVFIHDFFKTNLQYEIVECAIFSDKYIIFCPE